jgi:hypothetical protein
MPVIPFLGYDKRPSSIPKRRVIVIRITTLPRFSTLLVLWDIQTSYEIVLLSE